MAAASDVDTINNTTQYWDTHRILVESITSLELNSFAVTPTGSIVGGSDGGTCKPHVSIEMRRSGTSEGVGGNEKLSDVRAPAVNLSGPNSQSRPVHSLRKSGIRCRRMLQIHPDAPQLARISSGAFGPGLDRTRR